MYVCVRTTFLSVLGQFHVMMAMPGTQCECCVVSLILCVCVCVCGKPLCMPVRKNRWVSANVSSVCVCRDLVFSMLGQFQVLMALPETQCE